MAYLPTPKPTSNTLTEDDEFDLPDAEAYFAELEATTPTVVTSKQLLKEVVDEFDEAVDQGIAATAAHSCLGLPEILERILLYVPPLEIYRLERVSTMFRDLISRSIPIRRHMYFVLEKYFVRKELNEILDAKPIRKSRLAVALFPLCLELYADRSGAGVKVSLAPCEWIKFLLDHG